LEVCCNGAGPIILAALLSCLFFGYHHHTSSGANTLRHSTGHRFAVSASEHNVILI
uniref:Secreted protein n=1 Tax=Gongylonema pulchrum TaxID=637853 RepID=A0A183DLK4_9BILA